MAGRARTKASAKQDDPPFEVLLEQLESTVDRLENGNLPLEESIALFEEGVRLRKAADSRLQEAERRVEILLKASDNADPAVSTSPYKTTDDEVTP